MYDGLTARYTFACPALGEARVALSAFRSLERLPGAAHPVVYHVTYACPCGGEHPALVSHDELDWAPLGLAVGAFLNFMTARLETGSSDLADLAARRIEAGEWPWSFFCYPEDRPRPVSPSSFRLVMPASRAVGVAVRCPVCTRLSVNLVSPAHVDLPFYSDREIGVVPHVFADDAARALDEFRDELYSSAFDARRLDLH